MTKEVLSRKNKFHKTSLRSQVLSNVESDSFAYFYRNLETPLLGYFTYRPRTPSTLPIPQSSVYSHRWNSITTSHSVLEKAVKQP